MRKGAKRKGGSKPDRKAAIASSASKNDDVMVDSVEATTQETQPSQEVEEAVKVESPLAKEGENEEEAKGNQEEDEEQAKPDSSTQQEKDPKTSQNDEAKGASSSQPLVEVKKEENDKPLRRGKRKRSMKNETEKKEEPITRAKRARATKPKEAEPEYFKEKRSLVCTFTHLLVRFLAHHVYGFEIFDLYAFHDMETPTRWFSYVFF